MVIHENTPITDLDRAHLSKYLADCLFFSFQYSQGGQVPQRLIFQYIANDFNQQGIQINDDIWQSMSTIANKQVETRIGKYRNYDEGEGNLYINPPNHPSLINEEPDSVLAGQKRVLKQVLQIPTEQLPAQPTIIAELSVQLIYRDLAYVKGGRDRTAKSGLDRHQSFLHDFALAGKAVPGPQVYTRMFGEVGEFIRELVAQYEGELPRVDVDQLFKRHEDYLKTQAEKPTLLRRLKHAFERTEPVKQVTSFEWLLALKQRWEERHLGESFFSRKENLTVR